MTERESNVLAKDAVCACGKALDLCACENGVECDCGGECRNQASGASSSIVLELAD